MIQVPTIVKAKIHRINYLAKIKLVQAKDSDVFDKCVSWRQEKQQSFEMLKFIADQKQGLVPIRQVSKSIPTSKPKDIRHAQSVVEVEPERLTTNNDEARDNRQSQTLPGTADMLRITEVPKHKKRPSYNPPSASLVNARYDANGKAMFDFDSLVRESHVRKEANHERARGSMYEH